VTEKNDSQKSDYLGSGADGIITKPFRIGQIEELMATALLNCDKSAIIPSKKSKKILVVDDDEMTLELLHNALAILGYDSVTAESGKKALEYYQREKFDLLITDYIMPEMSGKELISAVKAIDADIPAVVITGYPLAYPAATARAEGISGYLKKPFRVNHLKEILTELFAKN
jgi:CheY-like chemotaxis protein